MRATGPLNTNPASAAPHREREDDEDHQAEEEPPRKRLHRRVSTPPLHAEEERPLSPKTRALLADEDHSGDSQDEFREPQDTEDEEEQDPLADEVDDEDGDGNAKTRKKIRKPLTKEKAVCFAPLFLSSLLTSISLTMMPS